ncbi:M23 family metallopeptidase [Pseudodonghicola xiamenensis]|uniref:Peptidase M23 n=1 Tax=Pseudodonghicola xiamenensis TaxID=337702 RepID=A0A8J3H831_9RHOB|nr:M23 family metallopeptidase [Pseudodonghicola xiamenensis]GHG98776.1 peptidase M23 [Pseudodonghicola xiamenensis]
MKHRKIFGGAAFAALLFGLSVPALAGDIVLGLPIDCTLGETCHIQQYVDDDPGAGAQDFRCGPLSYEGHKGTDFALPSLAAMQAGVDVLAAAPGRVKALRDGMPDRLASEATAGQIAGRECGNGVLIDHGDGWETQYCHMKSGSITVREGQQVAERDILGQVGLSGRTQFPHVHLTVRHDGAVIDPFAPDGTSCTTPPAHDLWRHTPAYQPGGLIAAGFATRVPSYDAVKAGTAAATALDTRAPALVLYGYAFGGRQGDVIEITINGPNGQVITHSEGLKKTQAQLFTAAGKRQPPGGWPKGHYVGIVSLLRGGQEIDRERAEIGIE